MSRTTFHTIEPAETPAEYYGGLYRHVAGIESESGLLMHPDVPKNYTTPLTLDVPTYLTENTKQYFDTYYIRNPRRQRNCHIAAAAISRALELDITDAQVEAERVMEEGKAVRASVFAIGTRGVFGSFYNGDPYPLHSTVGVGEGIGIQTDSLDGGRYFSLVSHEQSLAFYRDFVFNSPHYPSDFPEVQMYSDY